MGEGFGEEGGGRGRLGIFGGVVGMFNLFSVRNGCIGFIVYGWVLFLVRGYSSD